MRNGCGCPTCKSDLTTIVAWRVHCDACGGDQRKCVEGKGESGEFAQLDGCRAFTSEGEIRPRKAKKQPPQPWVPKPSKKAA